VVLLVAVLELVAVDDVTWFDSNRLPTKKLVQAR